MGKVEKILLKKVSFYTNSLAQVRLIRIYLPENYYEETRSYPVLYMHDGQNIFQDNSAIGGHSLQLKNYLDENELEVIVVGIDQNSDERINEYCPWVNGEYSKKFLGQKSAEGGRGKEYVDFIINELKPFVDNNYRTLIDHTGMAGISLGGLITIYAMCRYPATFRNVAVLSSAFYRNQEEIEKLIRDSDLSPIESIYLDCGTKEAGSETIINKEFLASNRAVYEILKRNVSNVTFEVIEEAEHNYLYFKERVDNIFTLFLGRK